MNRRDLNFLVLKACVTWLVLSGLVWYGGESLIKALFPLIKAVMITLTPELSPSLKLVTSELNPMIELSVLVLRPIYLNAGQFISPMIELKSSVHVLQAMVPFVIEGTILLIWPVRHWSQRFLLVGMGFLMAVVVVMAVLPARLSGKIELFFQSMALNGINPRPVPWFVDWMVFCEMGGSWLLGIAAALICIQFEKILR